MKDTKKILIFDSTLRDGQQCPGAGMSFENNLAYARLASDLGVDVLEAGFPSASKLDFEIVNEIATELASRDTAPTVAGLCQLRDEQIDITIEALLPATAKKRARLHVYVPVDPELMEVSLGALAKKKDVIQKHVFEFSKRAVDAGLEVEFSPEGYSRQGKNFDFVTDLIFAAVEAGVTVINCPDTIGGACQFQGEEYFVNKMTKHAELVDQKFPNNQVIWSAHCHNDFGLAVQNSINAVFNGPARQIEGCFAGVGERAGNAALEQCILIIKHFATGDEPFYTDINTEKLHQVCSFVGKNMLPMQPHWPVSGTNATKHSSGGHTNAILKNPLAYQPFDPKEVGREISFLFGPLSGGNHAKAIIEERGYACEDSDKAAVAQSIKEQYKERRKGITDDELFQGYFDYRKPINVNSFDYSRSSNRSEIILQGRFFDQKGEIREVHEGPDSALAALKKAIAKQFGDFFIQSHRSESEGKGIEAKSVSSIVISVGTEEGPVFEGIGIDQDIEISAMKALINAVNTAYVDTNFKR